MRPNAMGHSRSPNSRDAKPAGVNAGINLNAHDLIVGLASGEARVVTLFERLETQFQVIVARAALAWIRRMPEGTAEERDLKSRTALAVHRTLRETARCPVPLRSLRVQLAPVCWEMRRQAGAVHATREARNARGPVCPPITDEEVSAYAPPKTVLSAAPATLSATA